MRECHCVCLQSHCDVALFSDLWGQAPKFIWTRRTHLRPLEVLILQIDRGRIVSQTNQSSPWTEQLSFLRMQAAQPDWRHQLGGDLVEVFAFVSVVPRRYDRQQVDGWIDVSTLHHICQTMLPLFVYLIIYYEYKMQSLGVWGFGVLGFWTNTELTLMC